MRQRQPVRRGRAYARSTSQSNPRGAAHERSGNSFRGGVSPRFTRRPEGQSTIEYVLVIAIIALVVLIAGPWVSSAIRNQFNTVAGAIGSGTAGESFREPQDIPDPNNGTAFAVYSEDDHSLMFYKRRGVPKVGDMFNYRHVTEVYTGFETARYEPLIRDDFNGPVNTPWYGRASTCLKVQAVDSGIKPACISAWFQNFRTCSDFDLNLLDTSDVTDLSHVFYGCHTVRSIDLSGWDLSSATIQVSMFSCCDKLESIDFGDWVPGKLEFYDWMFSSCRSLSLDCSDWNVSPSASHIAFAENAPGVILPKAWE